VEKATMEMRDNKAIGNDVNKFLEEDGLKLMA
jgi:hypothetical protein